MKAFTIDIDNNVTVHASAKAAPKTEGIEIFTSQDALAELAAAWPASRSKKVPKPAKKAVRPAGSGPCETSKTAQLIEMLKRAAGATLEQMCKRFGWLPHTTRAMMSAGGSLTKKHGITVTSEKVGDERRYSVKG